MGASWSEAVNNAEHVAELRHVLKFLPLEDKINVLSTNKAHRALHDSEENWIWMCELLREEYFLYVRRRPGETWFETFVRHYPLRDRWSGSRVEEDIFSMKVCAKFRPLAHAGAEEALDDANSPTLHVKTAPKAVDASSGDEDDASSDDSENIAPRDSNHKMKASVKTTHERVLDRSRAIIPFHQRVRMIQAFFNCTASEARKRLWMGSADLSAAYDPWKHAQVSAKDKKKYDALTGSDSSHATSVGESMASPKEGSDVASGNVEKASNSERNIGDGDGDGSDCEPNEEDGHQLPTSIKVGVLAVRPATSELLLCASGGLKRFVFDTVVSDGSGQAEMYEQSAHDSVGEFLNGINACVLAYGQTGSGKTFTMFGPTEEASTQIQRIHKDAGIVPRILQQVACEVNRWQSRGMDATLKLSCVEIYGQDVRDLLHEQSGVGTWHGMAARMVLNMECAEEITDWRQTEDILVRIERSKRREKTEMNERSSRAHTVMMLELRQRHPTSGAELKSMLCLADLGGSEQLKKSKAEGQRKLEAAQINLGLLALKRCIAARREGGSTHVPYGDSTLTAILRPSLEGNSLTTVVVTGRLEPQHAYETLETMRFGEACQGVSGGVVQADVNLATEAIDAINKELEELAERIKSEERWVNKVTVREDLDGKETVITTVLEGAEELRGRYEDLLQTRRELIGV